MNSFGERLKNYRTNDLNISTKREMAQELGISEQLYAMFERGAREPSKNFLKTLSEYSKIPESYWRYGIENDYIEDREDFSCTKEAVTNLIEDGFIDKKVEFSEEVKDILLTSLEADLKHLFLKQTKK